MCAGGVSVDSVCVRVGWGVPVFLIHVKVTGSRTLIPNASQKAPAQRRGPVDPDSGGGVCVVKSARSQNMSLRIRRLTYGEKIESPLLVVHHIVFLSLN